MFGLKQWYVIEKITITVNHLSNQILPICDPSRQKGHVVGKHCFEIEASKVREI